MITNTLIFQTSLQCERYSSCYRNVNISKHIVPSVVDQSRFIELMHELFRENIRAILLANKWYMSDAGVILCESCNNYRLRDEENAKAREEAAS